MTTIHSTSKAPEWAGQGSDAVEDLDEPPEPKLHMPTPKPFQRSQIRLPLDQPSLLTKAILEQSDDEDAHATSHINKATSRRRRSMTSNVSVASTADLTSDTGLTSPSRASTPSPPIPDLSMLRLNNGLADHKSGLFPNLIGTQRPEAPAKELPKKRCIQFACAAKPQPQQAIALSVAPAMVKTSSAQEAPKRPTIKFACQDRPASTQNTPPKPEHISQVEPSTPKSLVPPSVPISPRHSSIRRLPETRPRFLRATSKDLIKDGSQFHEFASGIPREDDWIRHDGSKAQAKLTIYDTLTKENVIRRLGVEAEEEAEMEEAETALEDEENEEEDDLDEVDEDDEEEDEEDDDDDDSDGYHTDEETGFAESDDEDDEDENMLLWTPSRANIARETTPRMIRRSSGVEHHSDSSIGSRSSIRRSKSRPIGPQAGAPDLPDSTDFVCGTLDEDRPVEEAYLSCLAARRNEKLRVIPQDIDPSFPTSDFEEDEEDANVAANESDDNAWVHGAMEDIHHEQDRSRKQKGDTSPRRLRSPPPKRRGSPAPKARGRSPKPLFDCHSPRRMRSPAPKAMTTPLQTPRQGAHIKFQLAGRPGPTQTKSLPRPAAFFRHLKPIKSSKHNSDSDIHVRGAIDIVKGLEKKRQRRKEKFQQKYCNRARRGQIPERKTLHGRGAERMKELGLLMAGKKDQGNYVMSF